MVNIHHSLTDSTSDDVLLSSIYKILNENTLLSMATINTDGSPHINTAYYVHDKELNLYVFTDPATMHGKNLENNPSVALTVFNSSQPFGSDLCGLQIFGKCEQCNTAHSAIAFLAYSKKFPKLLKWAANINAVLSHLNSRFYRIQVESLKVFDEPVLGKEVFVPIDISDDR